MPPKRSIAPMSQQDLRIKSVKHVELSWLSGIFSGALSRRIASQGIRETSFKCMFSV